MLDQTAQSQGVEVGAGDVVLVRTGFMKAWLESEKPRRRRRQSGLACSTIDWIADRDVAMVAADNRTVEVVPGPAGDDALPFHVAALRDLGLLVGELFDLEDLAAACKGDGVYEFLFVAMPLPLVNGVGSPLNPVAIK
jgi:kynurenine formamidase